MTSLSVPEELTDAIEWVREGPSVDTAVGDPVERDGRTVVPVATVRYAFGGGWGAGGEGADEADSDEPEESDAEAGGYGQGGGLGGHVSVTPVGAFDVDDDGTRFLPAGDGGYSEWGTFVIGLVTFAVGLLIGRALGRGD